MPTTLKHGGFSVESAFDVVQHHYMANEESYVETGEVRDGPSGQTFYVCKYDCDTGYMFAEFASLEAANRGESSIAYGTGFEDSVRERVKKIDGFVKFVVCPKGTAPWFYARGKKDVDGDRCPDR